MTVLPIINSIFIVLIILVLIAATWIGIHKRRQPRCPRCGSRDLVLMHLEGGAARECINCGHWGYLA